MTSVDCYTDAYIAVPVMSLYRDQGMTVLSPIVCINSGNT